MASVTLKGVAKRYGEVEVLHDIDLEIASGEFVVVVGPSGCGKSTLLRIIAGLESLSEGVLEIGGRRMDDVAPARRGVAMVFQNYALYPHMSVRENFAFALRLAGLPRAEIERRVRDTAEFLQLAPYLDRAPRSLSGGQRQRVAIGRAIVREPAVFLFDEPLSNLDAALRVATRLKLAELNDALPDTTMIHVTHDQVEAMTLADRIVVLSETGGIEQIGTPLELYLRPSNLFVARFIGSPAMNILPATLVRAGACTRVQLASRSPFELPFETPPGHAGAAVQLGVRPEHLSIATDAASPIAGRVAHVEVLGEVTQLYVDIGLEATNGGSTGEVPEERLLVVKLPGIVPHEVGATIGLTADLSRVHLFDADGSALAHARAAPGAAGPPRGFGPMIETPAAPELDVAGEGVPGNALAGSSGPRVPSSGARRSA